jgi:hypothetical protein
VHESDRAVGPWLDPLGAALDEAAAPITFFFRDDDAGWEDERLVALLEVFESRALPLDLAVIPRALSAKLAASLMSLAGEQNGWLGLHQHGLAHVNQASSGRKCEFGWERNSDAQRRDIIEGLELLASRLPGVVQPVFTPPWNRCSATTGEVLHELGFRVLSRHTSEQALGLSGLAEVPVSVDWTFAKRDGRRLTWLELGSLAGERVRSGAPVGVNLHHAVMDSHELDLLGELCDLLVDHPAVRCQPLIAIADIPSVDGA